MTRRTLSLLALVAAATFGACYNEDAPLSPQQGLKTQILLTDAPFPYDSVSRVDIYIVSIEASTGTDTTDSAGTTQWVTVTEPKRRFNMLDLQQGVTADLGGDILPSGRYRSLKMIIDGDSSSITSKSGAEMFVNWGWTTKPKLYALVEAVNEAGADSARIVIDFDVGQSFYPLTTGGFLFLPVLRAVNENATGSIEGVVRGDSLAASPNPIGDVTITVYSGNLSQSFETWSVRATGRTDENGHFRIAYLMPGTYIVRSDAPRASPFSPGIRSNVVVSSQVTTDSVDITLPRRSASNIVLNPSSRQLALGASDSLYVYATDSLGQALIGATFSWRTSFPDIVSVSPFPSTSVARIQGLAVGTSRVDACYAGSCAQAFITVGSGPPANPVATVTIVPSSLNMQVGDSVAMGATLRDSAGNTLTGRQVAWAGVDSSVIRVFGFGQSAVVRALKPGSTTVMASVIEGKFGYASVTVLNNP